MGLLVLRMNRQQAIASPQVGNPARLSLAVPNVAGRENGHHVMAAGSPTAPGSAAVRDQVRRSAANGAAHLPGDASPLADPDPRLLRDAHAMRQAAAARGERLSQRALARQLRGHGHRFPNQHLGGIARAIGLDPALQQAQTDGR